MIKMKCDADKYLKENIDKNIKQFTEINKKIK